MEALYMSFSARYKFLFLLTIISVVFFACRENSSVNIKKNEKVVTIVKTKMPVDYLYYETTKKHVHAKRDQVASNFRRKELNLAGVETQFVKLLTDSIFPYWYGTTWDFNGITETPGQGTIACGYFVSTTLQHMGVKLNRYKIAQMASQQIISSLITVNPKRTFSNVKIEDFVAYVQRQGFGIYIVGLDNHVGFLYHDGTTVYFIHSKYYNPSAVVKELALSSGILGGSAYKVVAKLSSDPTFLKRWLIGNK